MVVAQLIVMQLAKWGIERIYGVAGDAIFGLLDAIAKQNKIRLITVRHESVAALMASAEAKLTGKLAVCIVQMGPGLANLVNGLGDAYMDQAPVLAISGQAPLSQIGTKYKQLIDQQSLVHPVSRYSQLVVHPDAVADSLKQAMLTSVLQRTVSHLSIPEDLFGMIAAGQLVDRPQITIPSPVDDALQPLLQIMHSAKQPMILVGEGARSSRESICALAKLWGCGIATGYGAVGVIPDSEPAMLGGLGKGGNSYLTELFQQADVVLAVETTWWPAGQAPVLARVLQIAKHQVDIGAGLPTEHGILGDPSIVMPRLVNGLESYAGNQAWIKQVQMCKRTWSVHNESERNLLASTGSSLHPASVIRLIESCLAEDAIVTLDEGDSTLWFLRHFRSANQKVLLSSRWRTMGFGLPAALSAKLNSPEKQVLCITGDGGLGMVLGDLITAVRYSLAITVVVFTNGALQMEADKMVMKRLLPEGTELTNPDFAKVAEACGWTAYRVNSEAQLHVALQQSRASHLPVLIDAAVARIPYPEFTSQLEEVRL
ncbi:thiamine pyrophosphate-binding protein [Paenibacillus koleovorans]|uniref:thiamine pyrophosphate-binding protein n=1 Tax=Paenibacillus koleovorans TaxID=121608 RepID=UPI000FDA996D|nr:thiamine pyrophosphate-binding protein [Paenibacillus koleovorans]